MIFISNTVNLNYVSYKKVYWYFYIKNNINNLDFQVTIEELQNKKPKNSLSKLKIYDKSIYHRSNFDKEGHSYSPLCNAIIRKNDL